MGKKSGTANTLPHRSQRSSSKCYGCSRFQQCNQRSLNPSEIRVSATQRTHLSKANFTLSTTESGKASTTLSNKTLAFSITLTFKLLLTQGSTNDLAVLTTGAKNEGHAPRLPSSHTVAWVFAHVLQFHRNGNFHGTCPHPEVRLQNFTRKRAFSVYNFTSFQVLTRF